MWVQGGTNQYREGFILSDAIKGWLEPYWDPGILSGRVWFGGCPLRKLRKNLIRWRK